MILIIKKTNAQLERIIMKHLMSHLMKCGAILLLLTTGITGCSQDKTQDTLSYNNEDCFWVGPYLKENPRTNIAYPDTGATYWHAGYVLPEGAVLNIKGQFPYARYMSLNSYDMTLEENGSPKASPVHAIEDAAIIPDTGAINPFVQGAQRLSENRDYTINFASGVTPVNPAPNTLYDNYMDQDKSLIFYRVYAANEGRDLKGGVDLPEAQLTLKDGTKLTGNALCETLNSDTDIVTIPSITATMYGFLRAQGNPAKLRLQGELPHPTTRWNSAYNVEHSIKCSFLAECSGKPERKNGWYANIDNQYVATFVDRSIKPIVVTRGKIPSVPATLKNNVTFNQSQAEVRYWSMCSNEFYSQKVTQCIYDENATINADGKYTIVTSYTEDRPVNATKENGVDFIEWSQQGDGYAVLGGLLKNTDDAMLLVRHMLPVNGFAHSIQMTKIPDDESQVMGDYLPTSTYFTKEEFEALGNQPWKNM